MSRHRSDAGFTLVEVLVATVVLGLIIGPMTAAIILGFKTEGTASERLTTNQGRFLLNVYLPRDAMQATSAYGSPVSQSNAGSITFGKICAGESATGQSPSSAYFTSTNAAVPLVLTWSGQPVSTDPQGHVSLGLQSYEVDYVLATEPGHPNGLPQASGEWLWRFAYKTSSSYAVNTSVEQQSQTCQLISGSSTLITRDIDPTSGAIGTVTTGLTGLVSASLKYTDSAGNAYTASGGARS